MAGAPLRPDAIFFGPRHLSLLITVPAPVQEAAIMEASRENVLEGEGVMKVPAPVQAAIVEARRENVRILFPACDALFCLVVSNSPATCAFWLCSRGTRLSGRGIRRDRHIEVYMDVCSC